MLFKRIIRQRLLSLLNPWLLEEPQLDLQLGFLNSLAVLTNLRFDVSVLNNLFDSPSRLFLTDLTVQRLTVKFSTWYVPAFTVHVHGVRLVLSLRNPEEEGCRTRRLQTPMYDYSDYLRKCLSVLDPEGCSVHHILEKILFAVPERKDFTASFLNLILRNFHLEADYIDVEVQFPILDKKFMYFGEVKEFSARSKYVDKKCLLRGILSTIFIPMKESSFILDGIGFRIGLSGENHTGHVLLSSDVHSIIELRDLKVADCSLCFPELACSFSPADISVGLVFDKLLSDNYNQTRSGRELWRIAASRIGHVTVTPRMSLQRFVGVIGYWIHYVNAYESIFLLTGYSTGHIFKRSVSEMSKNKLILNSARYQWDLISDIEKELPAEGIALARRIARHRAALKVQSDCDEEFVSPCNFVRISFFILTHMWKVISNISHYLLSIFFGKKVVHDPDIDGYLGSHTKDPCQKYCLVLNFGKIRMTVSKINETQQSVYEKLQSHTGIAYSDFLSICFCIDALILVSVKDIFEQRVTLSCGQMKVEPAPWTVSSEESTTNMLSAAKGIRKESINDLEPILWVEPAKIFLLSETNGSKAEYSCRSHIESFMTKLSLSWKGICSNFNEGDIKYSENPCFLCKVEISSTYPDNKNLDFGFCECSLMLGKLNLVLTHSSVSSMSLLLSQMQHATLWEDRRETSIASNFVDKTEVAWADKYEFYSKRMIMALLQKLPEKHIHFGVFVDGPCVRFSHRSKADLGGQGIIDIASKDSFDLTLDFHEIELALGPPLFGMAPLTCQLRFGDAKAECTTLEPHVIEFPKPNNDKYASFGKISVGSYLHLNGINACLEKSSEKHQIQLFVLKPVTIQILSFRDYIYSLSTTISAFSAALDITTEGFTTLSFLDEVYMIYKAVGSLSFIVSYLFSSFEDVDCIFRETMKQEAFSSEPDSSVGTIRGALHANKMFPFFIKGTCRFKSIDVILHNSRTSNTVESSAGKFDFLTGNKIRVQELADCGIWISIEQATIVISCEEGKMDLLTDLSGITSFVFKYQTSTGNNNNHILLENLLLGSVHCLHEISLSGSKFTLCLGRVQSTSSSGNESKTLGSSNSDGNISYVVQETNPTDFENSNNQPPGLVKKIRSPVNNSMPASASHWLLINVAVTNIFIGKCSIKSNLVVAHQSNELLSSLSIGGEFQMISWVIQGGLIVLETTSLGMAIDNYSSYIHYIGNLTSDTHQSNKGIKKGEQGKESYNLNDENDQGTVCTSQQAESTLPDSFDLSLSHSALVFALENESGGIQEIVLEVDIHLKFELTSTGRKLTVDVSHLSILSQFINEKVEDETTTPHFSSVTSKDLSPHLASEDPLLGFQNFGEFSSVSDASSSRDSIPLQLRKPHQILKDLRAFMSLDRPDNGSLHLSRCWFGVGSLSGFDMTLSLSEFQTILSMASSLSGLSSQNTANKLERNHSSTSDEVENSLEALIPDGAIVAIQDVNQHMYLTVEGEEKAFSIGGIIHYSLVGERALFRVKYCTQRRWNSTVLWFSLISLFAKSDRGVPLRLNCRPRSCFVDISCSDDGGSALWRVCPPQGESYEGITDWEPCNELVKRTFYLENKRNNSAIAFVDGSPEFVRKPGNPIKFKVFQHLSSVYDVSETASYPGMTLQTSVNTNEESTSWQGGKLPCVDIKIENISLNIVHELSDTEDLFPLICFFMNNTQFTIQNLATKSRVIGTSSAVVNCFDAQRNLWGELLHPVEISIFYRSNVQTQLSEYASRSVPVNYFCRFKELNISLSENSLDVLLFVIGTLNLSGPYSLRSSMILANCCKVENQSGLNLLLQFNQQKMTIPRQQSASLLLRRPSDLKNQDSEAATSVAMQLSDFGSFATTSIRFSLSQTQTLAWRTRIMSNEGSRTFPGPIFVVSIFRNSEVGLLVVVTPLIRIHNETGFPAELQFQRPDPKEDEFASVLLKPGDSIDDSMAMFDAINFSGGVKRALTSISVGNFLFSFRPRMAEEMINSESSLSVEWSERIKGGKAVRLSGLFDKLNFRVRKALFVQSVKSSFTTAHCALMSGRVCVANMHFLIQTIARDIPVATPNKSATELNENSPVSLLEQKEIYLLPTVRMTNLLHTEIDVLLRETDQPNPAGYENIGKQATISHGSTVEFYANPTIIYFTVTLTACNSSSKLVNSGDCLKKLLKQKNDLQHMDINLDFDRGKFSATLRLYRGNRGMLEVVAFTSYSLKNDTDIPIYVLATKRWPLSRTELDNLNSNIPSELGLCLPPKSTRSWFMKSKSVQLKLLDDHTSEALLDLDSLSGLTEISFKKEEGSGVKSVTKLGVSSGPSSGEIGVPSQTVTLVPRYVICNESEGCITVRQCYFQDEGAGDISVDSKQKMAIQLKEGFSKTREFNVFEHFIRKHRSDNDNSLLYIQIQTNEPGWGWSGPVCIASLGHFFLKFRKQSDEVKISESKMTQFAAVHVVQEGSTLVLSFCKPPNLSLPYRIENYLHDLSITYYQKDSLEPEFLGPACSADYVWDDLTLPRRLVIRINDSFQLHEIKLDKVRAWKPFYKLRQQRALVPDLLLDKRSRDQMAGFREYNSMEMENIGYEIYAEGPTRVLRICEISDSFKKDTVIDLCAKFQLRVSHIAIHLLEHIKQEENRNELKEFSPFIVVKVGNLHLITVSNNRQRYNQFSVQYVNLELKWNGTPFASMLRRHQLDYSDSSDLLKVVFVLLTSSSDVKQVRYSSVFLQPIDLNLDEETLMKIASFWRTSLSDSESQRFYFDHFEIHPIKIIANFIPGEPRSNYSSAQEALRSLIHSVVKVPPIKNMVVELNGVLITHALITMREIFIKCAQHYSWYAMRAIYIAKGSPLLPPDFVSIFDDMSSSSLDIFFDPSRGLANLPGLTLGTFKFISKCIKGKGFSGTKRYFGDLGKTLRSAGSNIAFAAVAEISDSILKGAEANGFNGLVSGFHQGILKLAMEPSLLGTALMEGGPDRKILLDRSPGADELYIEGYIQAMLDTVYRQEYLRVRVLDNQVILKNLPPNHSLINEIMDRVKEFLVSKALLKGDPSTSSHPLRRLHGESEWRIGPTILTLFEHLFVSFAIRMLRKQAKKFISSMNWKTQSEVIHQEDVSADAIQKVRKGNFIRNWGIGKFILSGLLAYIDGRLCRSIPNPVARRVVSGFLLSFIDQNDDK
ncbi:putative vacuolar protein sorting-associated protein [Lupinus albus]|uniref:Putative vacuolar protein sorting-associated protein n=1 Tax=Lupinus albus TaxID=3870 RepID=A0A6A4QLM2_LUPAL|nr:putative vacuolar protein sorting-associated protein [Lupinus albus]